METISILKSTKDEQSQNTRLTNYFVHAFNGSNVEALKGMLHKKGLFLGKYSRERMAAEFYNMFFGKDHEKFMFHHARINRGIALDKIPGAEVVEIRLSTEERSKSKFGAPADPRKSERVFRFCFRFKDDLICDIQIPKHFIESPEILSDLN
jgi:hypothetical protein